MVCRQFICHRRSDYEQVKVQNPLVQAYVVRKTLHILDEFVHISQKYQEENIIRFFRESTEESRETFLKVCSKPNGEFINLSYPINLSQFNEET